MRNLLHDYAKIKDELMDYTMEHYDSMSYDIEGYHDNFEDMDEDDLHDLKSQVKAARMLLNAYKKLNYKFG